MRQLFTNLCSALLVVFIQQASNRLPFQDSESWIILSPLEQSIKEKINSIGTPLSEWDIQINYGIKTGLNEAFIISGTKKNELIALDPKSAEIIRPYKHSFSGYMGYLLCQLY